MKQRCTPFAKCPTPSSGHRALPPPCCWTFVLSGGLERASPTALGFAPAVGNRQRPCSQATSKRCPEAQMQLPSLSHLPRTEWDAAARQLQIPHSEGVGDRCILVYSDLLCVIQPL